VIRRGEIERSGPIANVAAVALLGAFVVLAAGFGTAAASAGHLAEALSPRLAALSSANVKAKGEVSQARTLSLPAHGPGSLLRSGNRVLVDIRVTADPRRQLNALRRAGAQIVFVSRRYRTVTAAVAPASLRSVAELPDVASVVEDLAPITAGNSRLTLPASEPSSRRGSSCPSGDVVSEGDTQLNADQVRDDFGLTGSGVEVGALSDSFSHDGLAATNAFEDVASGDLPGASNPCAHEDPVRVLNDFDIDGHDEGRAMLQIVHDLAPGAALAFATGSFSSSLGFANNIRALRNSGADVIVDDLTYLDEPFFQDGPVSVAVNDVTADGAAYFTNASNFNIAAGTNDIGSWEAPAFRDAGACPPVITEPNADCMDFDSTEASVDNTYGIDVAAGARVSIDLQWAQPWNGVDTDLDLYFVSADGSAILAKSESRNLTTQRPFEFVSSRNSSATSLSVNLVVARFTGAGGGDDASPRLKFTAIQPTSGVTPTEYTSSDATDVVGPAIFGHNGAASAMSVAAVPFLDSSVVESYSSRGPVTLYFGPVLSATPAAPITPAVVEKPDIAATDCNVTTFFAQLVGSDWRFCGTSAASPHAAAVAALMLDGKPSATFGQIREAMTSTAAPVGAFGSSAAGAGLLDAAAATTALGQDPPPPDTELTGVKINKRQGKARFAFAGSGGQEPLSFQCRLGRRTFADCISPRVFKSLRKGRYTFEVTATDALDQSDPTPATHMFKIRRRHQR
jgi:Subtilase family